MDAKNIQSFEDGELNLIAYKQYIPNEMEFHTIIANINRERTTIHKNFDEERTGHCTLSPKALERIAEGQRMVDNYWNHDELAPRHVLLYCGCVIDWDDEDAANHNLLPEDHLVSANRLWCKGHDDVYVYRYNPQDFQIVIPHRHVLLSCGQVILWEDKSPPQLHCSTPHCPVHEQKYDEFCYVHRFDEQDFVTADAR